MDVRFFYNKNPLLVMSYISKFNGKSKEVAASNISKHLGLSIGSVYNILKEFNNAGLIIGEKIGRATIYEPIRSNPLLKQFRIFDNLLFLNNLVQQLKNFTRKIILFGSCARGDDTIESDLDLFLLVDEELQPKVRGIISDYPSEREINAVIIDSAELLEMQSKDQVFYEEIWKGITLWSENNEYY
ncbi:MAG: nucleotidyltransferase domain-containing protein [Peptococcia bacterium]